MSIGSLVPALWIIAMCQVMITTLTIIDYFTDKGDDDGLE